MSTQLNSRATKLCESGGYPDHMGRGYGKFRGARYVRYVQDEMVVERRKRAYPHRTYTPKTHTPQWSINFTASNRPPQA